MARKGLPFRLSVHPNSKTHSVSGSIPRRQKMKGVETDCETKILYVILLVCLASGYLQQFLDLVKQCSSSTVVSQGERK